METTFPYFFQKSMNITDFVNLDAGKDGSAFAQMVRSEEGQVAGRLVFLLARLIHTDDSTFCGNWLTAFGPALPATLYKKFLNGTPA